MDQLRRHVVESETKAFIASIDQSMLCDLASSFHPERRRCRVFSEPNNGSYNICFFVVFLVHGRETDEKWVIRIPLAPRLAFPEEKMRSEIATMKYISHHTSIPIPHIHGYGFSQTHSSGLTFMLLSYVHGVCLSDCNFSTLEPMRLAQLHNQLADMYIQLRQCEFPHVGSFTLDPRDDQTPVFQYNRPLSVDINDQEMGGSSPSSIVGPSKVYTTAVEYVYAQIRLLFNQFDKQQNSVYNESDARHHLYGLHQLRSVVMGWLKEEYNEGPFFLTHGDLRMANVIVDEDMNITGILDWEWSRTVPVQMFLPPSWLHGRHLRQLLGYQGITFGHHLDQFRGVVKAREKDVHCRWSSGVKGGNIPLSKLWERNYQTTNYLIGQALLRLDVSTDIYWDCLDRYYFGTDVETRVNSFYEMFATRDQQKVVARKLEELNVYNAKLKEQGLPEDKPWNQYEGVPAKVLEEVRRMVGNLNKRQEEGEEAQNEAQRRGFGLSSSINCDWSHSVISLPNLSRVVTVVALISVLSYTFSRH